MKTKKILAAIVLTVCMLLTFTFAACRDSDPQKPSETTPPNGNGPDSSDGASKKVLIAYFSWSGTTTALAKHVSSRLPYATLYRIERAAPYSDDYSTVAYGDAKKEADGNARPPIKNPLSADEMKKYDAVIIMYPIWWHTAPMTVGTFLETYDLSGTDIYPLTQSASMDVSQFNESFAFVEECAKKNGTPTVHAGLGTKSESDIDGYLRANGLIA